MKLFFKNKIGIAFLMLLCLLAGGCSSSKDVSESKSAGVSAEKVKISFSFWGNEKRQEYTRQAVDEFMELHPEIEVSINCASWGDFSSYYDDMMKTGTECDVMQLNYSWLSEYSPDGSGYYDLKSLSKEIGLDNFTPDMLRYGYRNGVLNAIPIALNEGIMVFNKSTLLKYKLSVPRSWEELYELANVIKEDGGYALGMDKWQIWPLLLAHYSQIHGDIDYSRELVAEVLGFYEELLEKKVVEPDTEHGGEDICSGKTAGIVCWINSISDTFDRVEEAGGRAVLGDFLKCSDQKKYGNLVKPATLYGIKKTTEHPKEAAILVDFLLNSRNMNLLQKTEKGVPLSRSGETYLMEMGELYTEEYKAALMMQFHMDESNELIPVLENNEFMDTFMESMEEYHNGSITFDEYVDRVYVFFTDN